MSYPCATAQYGGGGDQPAHQPGGQGGDLTNQIVNTVKLDMEGGEKSGQWIFSCYSPASDCVSVPGMEDVSPEELRLEAYVAKASGTTDQYTNRVNILITEFSNMRNKMKNPDQNLRQTLVKIYNKENISGEISAGGCVGMFGSSVQPSGGGMFGGSSSTPAGGTASSTSGGIFGGSTSTAVGGGGLFGKSSTAPVAVVSGGIFSANPSSTAFGTSSTFSQTTQAGNSIFVGSGAQTTQNSLFGGTGASTTNTTSVFGGGPAAQSGGSVFGGAASSTVGSVFGGSSVFGSTPSQSVFGTAAATAGVSSLFGGSSQSSTSTVASNPQPSGQALFGGAGTFGAAAQTSTRGLFGSSGGDGQTGSGLFGKSEGGGLFGRVEKQMDPSCIWTPLDQLTEAEKAAFLAPEFELGFVPTRPPPRELCF